MAWAVLLHDDFVPEFEAMSREARVALAAWLVLLRENGPHWAVHMPTHWLVRVMRT